MDMWKTAVRLGDRDLVDVDPLAAARPQEARPPAGGQPRAPEAKRCLLPPRAAPLPFPRVALQPRLL